jgi:hypothetical protein
MVDLSTSTALICRQQANALIELGLEAKTSPHINALAVIFRKIATDESKFSALLT